MSKTKAKRSAKKGDAPEREPVYTFGVVVLKKGSKGSGKRRKPLWRAKVGPATVFLSPPSIKATSRTLGLWLAWIESRHMYEDITGGDPHKALDQLAHNLMVSTLDASMVLAAASGTERAMTVQQVRRVTPTRRR